MTSQREFVLWDRIKPHLGKYRYQIAECGVRYGSVIYFGFGDGLRTISKDHSSYVRYPVEMELGSNNWHIKSEESAVLDSDFADPELARSILRRLFLDRQVRNFEVVGDRAILWCSESLVVEMDIDPDPASGFLISFDTIDGVSWETIDGRFLMSYH